ncbi:MAG TPA: hypothetical protein VFJ77_11940 [Gaiellaceae bacterium]|nr:hypothetical protein [Gaiellaceae bacterium]
MKYLLTLAAAVAAALALATVARAGSAAPGLSFGPADWLTALAAHPDDPKPIHRPRSTPSLYERTVDPSVLRRQGCDAAKKGVDGIVILDFGKLAYDGRSYGTILFSDTFASNRAITQAMLGWAQGYAGCLADGSSAHVDLARGTSNYHPAVPSVFRAGRLWARETEALGIMLHTRGLDEHVWTAAADDAEPAWDPGFRKTRDFFRGYRAAGNGRLLYNYGSLDGGVGSYWTARQLFYVSGGMRYARVVPEIYNEAMAAQWAELAAVVRQTLHRDVRFAGVMTQYATGCGCSLTPPRAHSTLVRALADSVGDAAPEVPAAVTNITAPR